MLRIFIPAHERADNRTCEAAARLSERLGEGRAEGVAAALEARVPALPDVSVVDVAVLLEGPELPGAVDAVLEKAGHEGHAARLRLGLRRARDYSESLLAAAAFAEGLGFDSAARELRRSAEAAYYIPHRGGK
jgi:hypothetical protein